MTDPLEALLVSTGGVALAEIGDNTQLLALAARYESLLAVVAGTTLGMMLANVPAVLLGEVAARRVRARLMNRIAAALFLLLGALMLVGGSSLEVP